MAHLVFIDLPMNWTWGFFVATLVCQRVIIKKCGYNGDTMGYLGFIWISSSNLALVSDFHNHYIPLLGLNKPKLDLHQRNCFFPRNPGHRDSICNCWIWALPWARTVSVLLLLSQQCGNVVSRNGYCGKPTIFTKLISIFEQKQLAPTHLKHTFPQLCPLSVRQLIPVGKIGRDFIPHSFRKHPVADFSKGKWWASAIFSQNLSLRRKG